jgi:GrpB-like predicted nucleotidyltransferase (UPF0157 family)
MLRCVAAEERPVPLAPRLRAAGVDPGVDPRRAWLRLRDAEGHRATIIDLYELVAQQRGLSAEQLPREERAELASWALPTIWPGFARTHGSERSDLELTLVPYDHDWPRRFESWRSRVAAALGAAAVRIEHVGSTAVPGLPAKPTVDVQISVSDPEAEPRYVPQVESVGLVLRSRDQLHRFFRPPAGQPREVHVHVCRAGSDWERDHLLFRDYLRANPEGRAAYSAAKLAAAARWADDRIGYTEAKTDVILDLLDQAETWARGIGWQP